MTSAEKSSYPLIYPHQTWGRRYHTSMFRLLFTGLCFLGFIASALAKPSVILFLGDSLTEGYGVLKEKAYPALIQKKLDTHYPGKYQVVNGSVSGSTTASAISRLKWFQRLQPTVVVLALGANDGLRGIQVSESKKNLAAAIEQARAEGIEILLTGMMVPPNYGPDYTAEFQAVFTGLAKEKQVLLIPFLLEGVAGEKAFNQADGIHPNEKGHERMAETVFDYLEKIL